MHRIFKLAALALVTPLFGLWIGCSSAQSLAPASADAGLDADDPLLDPANLAAPTAGQGFQMKTPPFAVPPGVEEQDCYFFKISDLAQAAGLPADQPVYLHRLQVAQKVGSHHMNLFRVKTIAGLGPAGGAVQKGMNGMGQCFVSSNWADWPLVGNTQQRGEIDWTYPDGVANEFLPTEYLMLQTHYVNATSQKSPDGMGEVAVNFWTLPAAQVTAQIGTLFATNQNIRICSKNPTPTFTTGCQIHSAAPVTIIGANGHFHSRGKEFDIFTSDGTQTGTPPDSARFYQSTQWDDPPMLHSPGLELNLPANGGVVYSCSYQWVPPDPSIGCEGLNAFDAMKHGTSVANQDCCYTFGPIVDKNEHCNAFVYYYPKQDDVVCE